jgi:hypothetical protein
MHSVSVMINSTQPRCKTAIRFGPPAVAAPAARALKSRSEKAHEQP